MFSKNKEYRRSLIHDRTVIHLTALIPATEIKERLEAFNCVTKVTVMSGANPKEMVITIDFYERHGQGEKQAVLLACKELHSTTV